METMIDLYETTFKMNKKKRSAISLYETRTTTKPDAILTQIVRPTGDIHNQDRGAGTATIVAENQ